MTGSDQPWGRLFAAPPGATGSAVRIPMRLIRKHGRPFLLVPPFPAPASAGLELYPAQKVAARIARRVLGWCYRFGIYAGAAPIYLESSERSPLAAMLARRGNSGNQPSVFSCLAGNPNAAGQRFIFLVQDQDGKAQGVIKAGVGEEAMRLIEQEKSFLRRHGGRQPGVPRLLDELAGPPVSAFALPYFAPLPERTISSAQLGDLLTKWLRPEPTVPLPELPQWQRLAGVSGSDPILEKFSTRLQPARVMPALYHGDLAAWNLRAEGGSLVVLDWERGEDAGPPAWDWFHYLVQEGILVRRQPGDRLLQALRAAWDAPEFATYARAAGIAGIMPELLLAYVLYMRRVIRPAEGEAGLAELQTALEQSFFLR